MIRNIIAYSFCFVSGIGLQILNALLQGLHSMHYVLLGTLNGAALATLYYLYSDIIRPARNKTT